MKIKQTLFFIFSATLILTGCMGHGFEEQQQESQEKQSKENAEKIFGFTLDPNHDWCMTKNGSITITPLPGTKTIQVLVYSQDDEESTSLKVLNSCEGDKTVTLNYDTPDTYVCLYVACVTFDNYYTLKEFKHGDREVNFETGSKARTRSASTIDFPYTLPTIPLTLTGPFDSYGKQRGWNNVTLYAPANENELIMEVPDFDSSFAQAMKLIIFSYFKNGKTYDNISLVKKIGYYNEKSYPITTGETDPIIVTPIYRNDGTSNEVINSDLYYYYFKAGTEPDLKNMKCYKAFSMKDLIKPNDVLSRSNAFALIYWDENGNGSFQFPVGYSIGFMLRSNLSQYNGQKQGEIWGDGRMNNELNKYGHFKSSKLGDGDPRMAWLTVNGKDVLCIESGTDKDVNDLIVSVSGSYELIDIPPYIEKNSYTFLFEDTRDGDYDLNDVVIKGERIDNTHIKYTLRACGATDELYLYGIEGQVINHNTEVHSIFGSSNQIFINTQSKNYEYVEDQITVSSGFSFLDKNYQPYIENRTKGYNVYISREGQDPHAIMIPTDFKWSKEKICIKDSYLLFGNWGQNMIESTDWYLYPEEDLVINP